MVVPFGVTAELAGTLGAGAADGLGVPVRLNVMRSKKPGAPGAAGLC